MSSSKKRPAVSARRPSKVRAHEVAPSEATSGKEQQTVYLSGPLRTRLLVFCKTNRLPVSDLAADAIEKELASRGG